MSRDGRAGNIKVRATGWAEHKEGIVVAENVILYYFRAKNKNRWTNFVRTKADNAAVHFQVSVLLECDAVSPGATHTVTQRHTDHSITVLLLTEH